MKVRRAEERDIPRIGELLLQVAEVHAKGRPDLFRAGQRKYTDEDLKAILRDPARPVFVAVDEDDVPVCYAFCADATHLDDNLLTPVRTLCQTGIIRTRFSAADFRLNRVIRLANTVKY